MTQHLNYLTAWNIFYQWLTAKPQEYTRVSTKFMHYYFSFEMLQDNPQILKHLTNNFWLLRQQIILAPSGIHNLTDDWQHIYSSALFPHAFIFSSETCVLFASLCQLFYLLFHHSVCFSFVSLSQTNLCMYFCVRNVYSFWILIIVKYCSVTISLES